jgi:hypothetical protein
MAITKSDTLNYRGELFLVGQNRTPFLNAISGKAKRASSFTFPMAQPYALTAASQPAIDEEASYGTLTPTTVTRAEDTNTAQIFLENCKVSFKKQSQFGLMSGINTNDPNPVTDEFTFQKMTRLRQMAIDMEYTFLNGVYQAAANTATAAKTRGIITGTTTNTIAASSAQLSRALIDQLLRTMFASGSPFQDSVIFVNGYQKQMLSKLYEYVPMSRTVGGASIESILTDFGQFGVQVCHQMPAGTLLVADLSVCAPVFVPVMFSEGDGIQASMDGVDVLWQPLATTAAARAGLFYSQAGIDYGCEEYHGTLTGLATS